MGLIMHPDGGKLLRVGSSLASSTDCCCGEIVPINSCLDMLNCFLGYEMEVTVAGVVDSEGAACCSDFDGVFICTNFLGVSPGCTINYGGIDPNECLGNSLNIRVSLHYDFGTPALSTVQVEFTFGASIIADYRSSNGLLALEVMCGGSVTTLDLFSWIGCDWPPTITLRRV